ncbi:hypothetical protein ACOMHN_017708 [Nucella lapillus]
MIRSNNSPHSFKPIPENKTYQVIPKKSSPSSTSSTNDTNPDPPHTPPAQDGGTCTPEAQIQELRKLLTDWQDDSEGGGDRYRGWGAAADPPAVAASGRCPGKVRVQVPGSAPDAAVAAG